MGDASSFEMVSGFNSKKGLATPIISPDKLRKIDLLRERNIGQHLPLPQLVAVGDQSSGKSSVLENLTGIPFPRAQDLCTRYATQISHRRDAQTYIKISIIPGANATPEEKYLLESYWREVKSSARLHKEFPTILEEVNQRMGIRTKSNPKGTKTFSEDVLKIEKCGPNEDHLTIIDVPGIFRIATEGITTDRDRDTVKNMIKDYINNPRTIILAVLPCTVDPATQEILDLAKQYDKTGERTLGVLTKPDLLTEMSAKAAIAQLVRGEKIPLELGYYVVRNRGGDETDDTKLVDTREQMFLEEPWKSLPRGRLGIAALRERLRELLGVITDRAFPELRTETRQMLTMARAERDALGPARQTAHEQRQYLVMLAGRFQHVVQGGLHAHYSEDAVFDQDKFRLITAIRNLSERFHRVFQASGHTYSFDDEPEKEDPGKRRIATSSTKEDLVRLNPEMFPGITDILEGDWKVPTPQKGIWEWISKLYNRSRGLELATFNSQVLNSMFREQSVNWELLAKQFVSQAILGVHLFVTSTLEAICTDPIMLEDLQAYLMSDLAARYETALKKAEYLTSLERSKRPFTLCSRLYTDITEARGKRIVDGIMAQGVQFHQNQGDGQKWVKISDVVTRFSPSNGNSVESAREQLRDTLRVYYKVASERFADNLYIQAVDDCLLTGPESPLTLFSSDWVLSLDDEALDSIASEPRRVRDDRQRLEKKIKDLEETIKILR